MGRPILSGNSCLNTHLSEIISELIDAITLERNGAEIQSTEEALEKIDQIDKDTRYKRCC